MTVKPSVNTQAEEREREAKSQVAFELSNLVTFVWFFYKLCWICPPYCAF